MQARRGIRGSALFVLLLTAALASAQEHRPVVRLSGSPEEIGRQHGHALKNSIGVMIKGYVEGTPGWQERKASLPETENSAEDPDIAGIVPGPQPLPPQFDDPDAEEPDSLD